MQSERTYNLVLIESNKFIYSVEESTEETMYKINSIFAYNTTCALSNYFIDVSP